MSNPSLTSFWAKRNRDRRECNQSLSNANTETASLARVPAETEAPKVESTPNVVDTTAQNASNVSFHANYNDIAFDNQTVATTTTPPTFAEVVKNEHKKWSFTIK